MKKRRPIFYCISILALLFLISVNANESFAQLREPAVVEKPQPKTPISEGFSSGIGFEVILNNFGFGGGGYYSKVLGPYSEFVFQTGVTGLRDVSEQNFQSYFTGQQIIPNKYKRGFGFPFLFGIKKRLFAQNIDDGFRPFISGSVGPAAAFVYPYIRDSNNNGYRDLTQQNTERINDFFSGWNDGEWEWGLNGEIKIGAEIGRSFKTRTTVEFGYFFYYFKQGIQIMEPKKPVYDNQGNLISEEPFFDAQKYFGTPQIKVTFGGMW